MVMRGAWWIVAVGLVALAPLSCKESLPPGPEPTSIDPSSGPRSTATPVTILGRNFEPHVAVDYDEQQGSRISSAFTARLGETALEQVTYVSATQLEAVVPAGLAAGTHDLTVVDPRGASGVLAAAFTVLDLDAGAPDGDTAVGDGPPTDGPPHDGTTDAKPPDAAKPDTTQPPDAQVGDGPPCPLVCSKCAGGTCTLPCETGCTCPAGWSCNIDCYSKICVGNVNCSLGKDCTINCASSSCTGVVSCGTGMCDVSCASSSCAGGVNCSKSCGCKVSCGSGACGPGVTCPAFCNNLCGPGDVCDSCP